MKIVEYPHPALLRPTVEIKSVSSSLRRDVDEMFDLMYQARGVGLAANQVALPYRLVVMNLDHEGRDPARQEVFLNPKIVARKGSEEEDEGCLSFPGMHVKVRRAKEVTVEAYDLAGTPIQRTARGFEARAWQHEIDHLDGKVFLDRFSQLAMLAHRREIQAFERRFRQLQQQGVVPPDADVHRALDALAESLHKPSANE